MKAIIFTFFTITILLASNEAAIIVQNKQEDINKYEKTTAKIEARIAQKEQARSLKSKQREERLQRLDAALKEKARIRNITA